MAIHSFAPIHEGQTVNRFGKGNFGFEPQASFQPAAAKKYRVTTPDGRRFDVTGNGTQEEALAHVQGQLGYQPDLKAAAQQELTRRRAQAEIDNRKAAGSWTGSGGPDFGKVKRNVKKMIEQNAPESDIAAYVASEGTSPEELRQQRDSIKLSLADFRTQYPQYGDLSDVQLAASLHKKFYGDMPFEKFASQIGLNPAQEPQPQWSDLPGNILPSMGNAAAGLYQAVRHPVQTATTLHEAYEGGMDRLFPNVARYDLQRGADTRENFDRQQQVSGAMGQAMKERYGGFDNLKRTAITDPFGSLLDASALATGGGSLLSKVPMAGTLSKGLLAAGRMADPVALTGKALQKGGEGLGLLGSYPLSMMTGATPDAIQTAYTAGKQGGTAGDAFRQNMRGHEGADVVVNEAKNALDNMADARKGDYMQNMQSTHASGMQIDPTPIYSAIDDLRDSLHVKPQMNPGSNSGNFPPLSKAAPDELAALDEIENLMNQWAAHPEGLTPAGLDALKQRISKMQPSPTAQNAGNLRRIVTVAENAVKNEIVKAVPEYGDAMADYAKSKGMTDEITRSLSLGRNASIDTAAAKLKSALGGNRKNRADALAELEANGAPHLLPRIAGQQLADIMPKGLLGKITSAAVSYGGWLNPVNLGLLPLTSPRFVGEAAHLMGRGVRQTGRAYGKGNRAVIATGLLGRATPHDREDQK